MRRVFVVLTLATVITLAACGSDSADPRSDAPNQGQPATPDDVRNNAFVTSEVFEDGSLRPLAAGSQLTLTFTDDGISANAGCNTIFGPVSIADGVLVSEGQLASTMMACEPSLMDQDQWLSAFLAGGPSASMVDGNLVLTSPSITMTLQPSVGGGNAVGDDSEVVAAVEALCSDLVRAGATLDEATAAAEESGYTVRITKRDGESFAVTMDYIATRMNLEIEGDIVTACTSG